MDSFVSNEQLNVFQNTYDLFFGTFSRNIIIFKESTMNSIQPPINNGVFGFGPNQITSQQNFSYSQNTGVYPALIKYQDLQKEDIISETNTRITQGTVTIKVNLDAKNFIESGKTVKINIDGRDFELISEQKQVTILNSKVWSYDLQSIDR